ncbi:MAG: hypothetical protein ACTHU6_05110 [Brevibacterium aurantiacum]
MEIADECLQTLDAADDFGSDARQVRPGVLIQKRMLRFETSVGCVHTLGADGTGLSCTVSDVLRFWLTVGFFAIQGCCPVVVFAGACSAVAVTALGPLVLPVHPRFFFGVDLCRTPLEFGSRIRIISTRLPRVPTNPTLPQLIL